MKCKDCTIKNIFVKCIDCDKEYCNSCFIDNHFQHKKIKYNFKEIIEKNKSNYNIQKDNNFKKDLKNITNKLKNEYNWNKSLLDEKREIMNEIDIYTKKILSKEEYLVKNEQEKINWVKIINETEKVYNDKFKELNLEINNSEEKFNFNYDNLKNMHEEKKNLFYKQLTDLKNEKEILLDNLNIKDNEIKNLNTKQLKLNTDHTLNINNIKNLIKKNQENYIELINIKEELNIKNSSNTLKFTENKKNHEDLENKLFKLKDNKEYLEIKIKNLELNINKIKLKNNKKLLNK